MTTIRTRIFESAENGCSQVASEIAQLVRARSTIGRKLVLGLATGDSILPLYDELAYPTARKACHSRTSSPSTCAPTMVSNPTIRAVPAPPWTGTFSIW